MHAEHGSKQFVYDKFARYLFTDLL